MKKIITLIFVLLLGFHSYAQKEKKIYDTQKFSIMYPTHWTLETNMGTQALFAIKAPLTSKSDNFAENVNLITQDLKGMGITLDQYVKFNKSQLATIPNGYLFSSKRRTRDGREYHELVFKGTMSNLELKVMQLYAIKGEVAYVLTFTSLEKEYEDLKDTGKEIIDTFKLK